MAVQILEECDTGLSLSFERWISKLDRRLDQLRGLPENEETLGLIERYQALREECMGGLREARKVIPITRPPISLIRNFYK